LPSFYFAYQFEQIHGLENFDAEFPRRAQMPCVERYHIVQSLKLNCFFPASRRQSTDFGREPAMSTGSGWRSHQLLGVTLWLGEGGSSSRRRMKASFP